MSMVNQQNAPSTSQAARGLDWGAGRYEHSSAAQLGPAARAVVETAAIAPHERVVDLGCGPGNAAFLAAARGARVVGVDPTPRLLELARQRATAEGVEVAFEHGDAASLPLEEASADAIISVFAVIFAGDPVAAAAEMDRVLDDGGRIVLSAWVPKGPMSEMVSTAERAVRQALGLPEPDGFAWHQPEALSALFGPRGFEVEVERHELAFTGTSATDFLDADLSNHPAAAAGFGLFQSLGRAEELRAELLDIFERGNENPGAFRITSPYVVARLRRRGS
jgi:SAM-dependent methyltransferase